MGDMDMKAAYARRRHAYHRAEHVGAPSTPMVLLFVHLFEKSTATLTCVLPGQVGLYNLFIQFRGYHGRINLEGLS